MRPSPPGSGVPPPQRGPHGGEGHPILPIPILDTDRPRRLDVAGGGRRGRGRGRRGKKGPKGKRASEKGQRPAPRRPADVGPRPRPRPPRPRPPPRRHRPRRPPPPGGSRLRPRARGDRLLLGAGGDGRAGGRARPRAATSLRPPAPLAAAAGWERQREGPPLLWGARREEVPVQWEPHCGFMQCNAQSIHSCNAHCALHCIVSRRAPSSQ